MPELDRISEYAALISSANNETRRGYGLNAKLVGRTQSSMHGGPIPE